MDLYGRPLDKVSFSRVRGGDQEEGVESGVLIAPIPGVEDAFALRDAKNPDAGTEIYGSG
jgi:hypothetical protein